MNPFTLTQLQDYANGEGGKLLSPHYKECKQKLLWQCRKGHQWKATWDGIRHNKSWCPTCAGLTKPTIEFIQFHAESNQGLLLSDEYVNNHSKLLWQCKEGHQWAATWNNVRSGKWCPNCAGKVKPQLSELKKFAVNKGGLLLSESYKDTRSNLLWQCDQGHQWKATWHSISGARKTWCPMCGTYKKENLCRELLAAKLGVVFNKTRFIYNGKRYEWDGYNSDLKVAFEYHGEQHYKPSKFFHKHCSFSEQQKRDKCKEQYASENGITLLVIPFSEADLSSFVEKLIQDHTLISRTVQNF